MEVDLDALQTWMSVNCGVCTRVGDPHWIEVFCPVARLIVYNGEPYNAEDTAVIQARVQAGPCSSFRPNVYRQQERQKALERYGRKHKERLPEGG